MNNSVTKCTDVAIKILHNNFHSVLINWDEKKAAFDLEVKEVTTSPQDVTENFVTVTNDIGQLHDNVNKLESTTDMLIKQVNDAASEATLSTVTTSVHRLDDSLNINLYKMDIAFQESMEDVKQVHTKEIQSMRNKCSLFEADAITNR